MCGETTMTSQLPASKVLGNDDLVGEILNHVDCPTALVRAALVSRRWLRRASDRAFLRRFRERHPPRLLGFCIDGDSVPCPEFVPLPPASDKLSAALRRAGSVFDAFARRYTRVLDSRNDRLLFLFTENVLKPRRLAVLDTLRRTDGAISELPSPPLHNFQNGYYTVLLPDDDRDDNTCYVIDFGRDGRNLTAEVSVLRSGTWTTFHCAARAELATALRWITNISLLAGGNVYTMTSAGYIIVVNLATANLFTIELPEGARDECYWNRSMCTGDDPALLYLLHATGDELRVWLRRLDEHSGTGYWVLRDTVSLEETCGHLVKQRKFGDRTCVFGVRDNAESVGLDPAGAFGEHNDRAIYYLHLGSKKAEVVYRRDGKNQMSLRVHPLETVWPPVFPALCPDEGEEYRQR